MNLYALVFCSIWIVICSLALPSIFADTLSTSVTTFNPPLINTTGSWWGALGDLCNVIMSILYWGLNSLLVMFNVMFVLPVVTGIWILTLINSIVSVFLIYIVLDFIHGLI